MTMIRQLEENYKYKRNSFIAFFLIFLLSILILSYINYKENEKEFNNSIDDTLRATAFDTQQFLGDNFFQRAVSKDAISHQEDDHNIKILSQLAKNNHVAYVYSFYFKDGKIHFTSSSATKKDFKDHTVTKYWDIYQDATPKLQHIFHNFQPFFEVSSDKWGNFKSILIPYKINKTLYVVGADIRTDTIFEKQKSLLLKNLLFTSIILGLLLFMWMKFSKILKEEITIIRAIQDSLYAKIEKKTTELNHVNDTLQKRVDEELEKNKQKEKQLLAQSHLAQMGEMIGMISHQWRQPLNAISATCIAIAIKAHTDSLDNSTTLEFTEKISNLTQHLSDTINDFRNFFQDGTEKKDVTYTQLINFTLNIVQTSIENQNIQIITNLQSQELFHTYSNELQQVLLNLIKNAEDALLEKNRIDPYIKITTKENILTVSDNAGGIPEDIIDKIFAPYFSTKNLNGTGLGLYMSKIIVEDHCKGRLSVTNSEDGAIFSIELLKE